MSAHLIDETGALPLRGVIGGLLTRATAADIAVGHLRLAALDLAPREVAGIRACRILVGRLDAESLDVRHERQIRTLLAFLASGRVQVRAAGMSTWLPDFSLYRNAEHGDVLLLGAHYFHTPSASLGPSFTCMLREADAVTRASLRFDDLWRRSYDVLPVVTTSLTRLVRR